LAERRQHEGIGIVGGAQRAKAQRGWRLRSRPDEPDGVGDYHFAAAAGIVLQPDEPVCPASKYFPAAIRSQLLPPVVWSTTDVTDPPGKEITHGALVARLEPFGIPKAHIVIARQGIRGR